MANSAVSFFTVHSGVAVPVRASGDAPATVTVLSGGTLYYKNADDVDSGDDSLAAGGNETFYATNWLVSASSTKVMVENHVVGVSAAITQPASFATWQPIAATSGTDTACSNGTAYVGSIYVPGPVTATGVGYLVGSVGGTDKVITSLHNSRGEVVANSATAGTTVGTAAQTQAVAFTGTVRIPGPDRYFIGVTFNGTTAKFRSVPAYTHAGVLGNGVTQTFGTVADFTPPTTFTADKVPVAYLY